jgi:putative DNA primase/helicase
MTVKTTHPCSLTVLRSANRKPCAKTWHPTGVTDYGNEATWHALAEAFTTIESLAKVIEEVGARDDSIIVYGGLIDDSKRIAIKRRMQGEGMSLESVPRRWLAVDVDGLEVPSLATEATWADYAEVARQRLPDELATTTCYVQATSSYRMKGGPEQIRARFWFVLDEEVLPEQLRAWARTATPTSIDPSIYSAVQPIYICAPRFKGVIDPLAGEDRGVLLPGKPEVSVSDLGVPGVAEVVRGQPLLEGADRPERCEAQVQHTVARLLEQTTPGSRHHHALGVACELFAVGATDDEIMDACAEVIARQGREPQEAEIPNLLRAAAQKFANGELRSDSVSLASVLPDDDDEEEIGGFDNSDVAPAPQQMANGLSDSVNQKIFVDSHYPNGRLVQVNDEIWVYRDGIWEERTKANIRGEIARSGADLSSQKVGNIASAVRDFADRAGHLDAPCWMDGKVRDDTWVFQNGIGAADDILFDAETALQPHTHNYFSKNKLPYEFDPEADCPEWKKALNQWFPGDPDAIRELQKMFGYLMTADTKQQKMFVLSGKSRSGKSTVAEVLEALAGEWDVRASDFKALSTDFGMENMEDGRIAIIDEGEVEGGFLPASSVSRIKSIVGRGKVSVNRKNKKARDKRLAVRFVILCNAMPRWKDASNAMGFRTTAIHFKYSFAGREDHGLPRRLLAELPGIFNWAMEGLAVVRYAKNKIDRRVATPPSAQGLLARVMRGGAPIAAFCQECLAPQEAASGTHILMDEIYSVYRRWCEHTGEQAQPRRLMIEEVLEFSDTSAAQRELVGSRRQQVITNIAWTEDGSYLRDESTSVL